MAELEVDFNQKPISVSGHTILFFKKLKKGLRLDYVFYDGNVYTILQSKLNKVEDKDFFVSFIAVWYIQKFPGLLINSRTVWSTKNTHTRIPPAMAFDGFIQHFLMGPVQTHINFFFQIPTWALTEILSKIRTYVHIQYQGGQGVVLVFTYSNFRIN